MNLKLTYLVFLFATLTASAQVQLTVNGTQRSHAVHPNIQGQGLSYSVETDSIYEDGAMAQLFKDVGAGFLRWPGGTPTSMYHWNDLGAGWVDNWNPEYPEEWTPHTSEFMDLDEYMTLTRAAGTQPMVGINMSSGMEWGRVDDGVAEAVALVKYCIDNDFEAKCFFLDNETYHHGNGYNKDMRGDGGHWTAANYAQQINLYADSIKKYVPDAKFFINWRDQFSNNVSDYETLLTVAGHNIDYVDVHWYWKWGVSNWADWKAKTPMEYETASYDGGSYVEEVAYFNNLAASLGKSHIKVAVLEWNIAPGDHNSNPDHTEYMTALMQSEMQMQFMQAGIEYASMWTSHWKESSKSEFLTLINSDNDHAPSASAAMFELYHHAIGGQITSSSVSDSNIMTTTVVKGDKTYVYLLNKNDENKSVEFNFNNLNITSVDQALRFSDPGELSTISLWNSTTTGNYVASIQANSLTMVSFNYEANTELLFNGDFENGLSSWDSWNSPTVTSDAQSGNSAIKIETSGSFNQWVTVEPSTTYKLTAFVKTDNSAKKVVLGVGNSGGNIATKDIYSTSYKEHEVVFTTAANTTSVQAWVWLPESNGTSAYADNMSLTKVEEVSNEPVTSLSLSHENETVYSSTTLKLSATVLPTNASDKSVVWESDNTSTAIVNANGLVTALTPGTATITATTNDGGFTANTTITVIAAQVNGIISPIQGNTYDIDSGLEFSFSAGPETKYIYVYDMDWNLISSLTTPNLTFSYTPTATGDVTYRYIFQDANWQDLENGTVDVSITATVLNADFELGLNSWDYYGGTTTETFNPHNGSTSLKINARGGASQIISLKKNTEYQVSFYAKVEDPSVMAKFHIKNALGAKYFEQNIVESNYTQFTINFTTDNEGEEAKIGFWRGNDAVGASYLDDVVISETTSSGRFRITDQIQDLNIDIEIYPNPASGFVTIQTNQSEGLKSLQILNLLGKIKLNSTFETSLKVPVSNFAKGTYFIIVTDQNNDRVVKKLIIN